MPLLRRHLLSPLARQLVRMCVISGLISVLPIAGLAQNKPFDDPTTVASQDDKSKIGFKQGSVVVAPIPFESPSLGTGLALGGSYLFQNDRLSEASSLTFGGFKSSNGSNAYGLGVNLAWDEDTWNFSFVLADADLKYDVYAGGKPFSVRQKLRGGKIDLSRKVADSFSVGGSLGYGTYSLVPTRLPTLPGDFVKDAQLEILRLSAYGEYDTRDDSMYPTSGALLSGTVSRGFFLGAARDDYAKLVLAASNYFPVFGDSVIATHAVACAASDDAPFFDACALGLTDNLRGYISTEFVDSALFSVQAEFRDRLTDRIGYVVFAGAGSVGDTFSDALSQDYKGAAGVGLRFRLSKSFPLDYAIDIAVNDRGEDLLYISIGQRF